MKFTCDKRELVSAIQVVSKALSSKPSSPILSGMYLKAEGDSLEIQTTDYELGFIVKIPAEVEENGHTVISGRYMQDVIRRLPGDNVTFTIEYGTNIVNITSNQAKFNLKTMNAEDFPTVKIEETRIKFTMKDTVLRNIIKKTIFACSVDDARVIFTGCSLTVKGDTLMVAGTNTHRLAFYNHHFDEGVGIEKIIVPHKALNEMLSIMKSEIPTDVEVTLTNNKINFQFENIFFTSRLIEGQFPNFMNSVPSEFATVVRLKTADFAAAVDRVSLISKANDYNVIRLIFTQGQVHISSNNPEIGQADEIVEATVDGPDVNIAFNSNYINDALKVLDSDEFVFSLNGSLDAASIRESEDVNYLYVVTPVRTRN